MINMMHSIGYIYRIFWFLIFFVVIIGCCELNSKSSAKSSLDSLLKEYAFKALSWPRTKTGTIYEGSVPSNLTGIRISALMLRRDSLKWRGFGYYREFLIPTGITVEPYVTRIVLVYQNLGNWSSIYYPNLPPGYSYQTPILGILAYDAMDMCAKNKQKLQIHALENPIYIRFSNVEAAPEGSLLKCVYFNSDNYSIEFGDVTNGSVCSTRKQGHFAIVAEMKYDPAPAPAPAPDDGNSKNNNNNNNQLSSQVLTISLGFLGFAFLGVLYVVAQKFILVERRMVIVEDSAAIIVPLLGGAANEETEVPMPEESTSLPENEYGIRPLPENDYVPHINQETLVNNASKNLGSSID